LKFYFEDAASLAADKLFSGQIKFSILKDFTVCVKNHLRLPEEIELDLTP